MLRAANVDVDVDVEGDDVDDGVDRDDHDYDVDGALMTVPRRQHHAHTFSHMLTHGHTCPAARLPTRPPAPPPARPLADMYRHVCTYAYVFTGFAHAHTCSHMLTHVHTCSPLMKIHGRCQLFACIFSHP